MRRRITGSVSQDAYFSSGDNKMNRYVHVALAFLLALFTVQAQAGIVIGGTRVVYDGDKRGLSVHP